MADAPYELAMFPLGTVLVPGAVLPLQLFEPRYLALADDVMASDPPQFGVVLIERGSEVGGGDARTSVGTVASVARAERFADDRIAMVAVGVRRIRVLEWLDDHPYPQARVEDWPDDDLDDDLGPAVDTQREVVALLRQALAVATELGDPAPHATLEISDDPRRGSLQVAAVAPLGPADRQAVLAAPGARERISALHTALTDALEVMRARLTLG